MYTSTAPIGKADRLSSFFSFFSLSQAFTQFPPCFVTLQWFHCLWLTSQHRTHNNVTWSYRALLYHFEWQFSIMTTTNCYMCAPHSQLSCRYIYTTFGGPTGERNARIFLQNHGVLPKERLCDSCGNLCRFVIIKFWKKLWCFILIIVLFLI